jgi:O-acetyl-ADP-ribose deacetylase
MVTLSIGERRLDLLQGELTDQTTDAIVNAANSSLLGGGGVDGVIHRRGGLAILEQCQQIRRERYPNGLPVAEAVLTGGGRLPARYVIHTVGPIWRGGGRDEDRVLRGAYERSLELASEHGLRSVAFASISTGAYGFPPERAAPIALRALIDHLRGPQLPCELRMVLLYSRDLRVFSAALHTILPTLPDDIGLELEA